jgi:hypothetical protein
MRSPWTQRRDDGGIAGPAALSGGGAGRVGEEPQPIFHAPFAWGDSGVAVGLGAGGFFASYPCTVYYIFAVELGACFTKFEPISACCRTAASAHGSSTGCSADGEEEWEVCGGGGWRGGHG